MSADLPVPVPAAASVAALTPPADVALLQADARRAIEAAKAMLDAPVFRNQVPLALLTRLASDPKVSPKEQLRASAILAQLQLQAIEVLGGLTGAREQRLRDLGIEASPQEVHVEQHNTKIEIVRQDARDWRRQEVP